jgi:DNA-binding GntR family transcriptional regulator
MLGILERDYKIEIAYSDEELDATVADPRTADLLDVPRREPLFGIRQVILSTDGNAVLYVLGFCRSDRHNLVIRRLR